MIQFLFCLAGGLLGFLFSVVGFLVVVGWLL
jgi:hypothetical protein